MSMKRFGDLALDWSRVFAVRLLETDFYTRDVATSVEVLTFLPNEDVQRAVPLRSSPAEDAWDLAQSDKSRFKIIGHKERVAIEIARVCHVSIDQKTTVGFVLFDLGNKRHSTLELGFDTTEELLRLFSDKTL